MTKCRHLELAFHSGGHYIQCKACKGWWLATKYAHTYKEAVDYARAENSQVTGGETRRAVT
jgi:hypothetical protein